MLKISCIWRWSFTLVFHLEKFHSDLYVLCILALKFRVSSDFVRLVAFVETFEELWRSLCADLLSSSVLIVINAMISYNSRWGHQIFIEITCLSIVPFSIVKQLVPNINFIVNVWEVLKVSVCSEVVSHKDLGLFRGGSVCAEWEWNTFRES